MANNTTVKLNTSLVSVAPILLTDLDDHTTIRSYFKVNRLIAFKFATATTNQPATATYGFLLVYFGADNQNWIEYYINQNGVIKVRYAVNNSFSSWKFNNVSAPTITPTSDTTLKRNSTTKVGNLVAGTIVASASLTNSQWLEIFTYSPIASSTPFKVPVVLTSDGTYLGMAEFTDNGKIRIYPKQTKDGEFSFSFAYAVAST